jgi:hypothetical protein
MVKQSNADLAAITVRSEKKSVKNKSPAEKSGKAPSPDMGQPTKVEVDDIEDSQSQKLPEK